MIAKWRILCVIIGLAGQRNKEKTPPFAKEESTLHQDSARVYTCAAALAEFTN